MISEKIVVVDTPDSRGFVTFMYVMFSEHARGLTYIGQRTILQQQIFTSVLLNAKIKVSHVVYEIWE